MVGCFVEFLSNLGWDGEAANSRGVHIRTNWYKRVDFVFETNSPMIYTTILQFCPLMGGVG
jgi:hypothetical protein